MSDQNSSSMPELGEYERKRAFNIERNNAKLRSLGLISLREEEESNAIAWGRRQQSHSPKTNKRKIVKKLDGSPLRRSKRLKQASPNGEVSSRNDTLSPIQEDVQERIMECRKARLEAANAYALACAGCTSAENAKKNPTATYNHCLMRVRTMSEKALETRIKVIERAAGKCCVIKMAIFKCCLEEEGYATLAKMAHESLERLKALLPPTDS